MCRRHGLPPPGLPRLQPAGRLAHRGSRVREVGWGEILRVIEGLESER